MVWKFYSHPMKKFPYKRKSNKKNISSIGVSGGLTLENREFLKSLGFKLLI